MNLRNIAIIAHVDHGKTTLVDGLLKQAHTFADHDAVMQQTTIMDSQDLERERGVTILAKNTAVDWHDFKINILDTPGHADFSGEVERVLTMADGCILLVDAAEGVLSQTRYVLSLALNLNLKPIVVINKVDRKDQRTSEVLEEISDLFLDLANDPSHLEFPVLYAVGREGIAGFETTLQADNSLKITDSTDLSPLFQTIVNTIPAPLGQADQPFQFQITTLDYDSHKGRYVIGKISRGKVKVGDQLAILRQGSKVGQGRVEYLFTFKGLTKLPIKEAEVGDIIAITGFPDTHIGDTLSDLNTQESLPTLPIAEPTLQLEISVSDSPFVGREGEFSTARQLKQRLERELETNVSLRITPGTTTDAFTVSGRGELHLGILIETMRREGFEFSVSRPQVIFKYEDGRTLEPYEHVVIEVPEEHSGIVITAMGQRKAELINMHNLKTGVKFHYKVATRHLIGFRSELLKLTSGLAIMHSQLMGYEPQSGDFEPIRGGAIIATETGQSTAYALENVQDRGVTFVDPGTEIYKGMIVGQNSRQDDMHMNVVKGKKLTNMRSSTADATVKLAPAVKLSLEQCLTFLAPDELLEVTPKNLRLRKRNLNAKH